MNALGTLVFHLLSNPCSQLIKAFMRENNCGILIRGSNNLKVTRFLLEKDKKMIKWFLNKMLAGTTKINLRFIVMSTTHGWLLVELVTI